MGLSKRGVMLWSLKNLFSRPQRHPIQDSVLGAVVFSEEEDLWEAKIEHNGSRFMIRIAGKEAPDPSLMQHAREVAAVADQFLEQVARFLKGQAAQFRGAEAEIELLRLESLNLFWPNRPNDGMLYFDGGNKGRVWRCDYINRKPERLGFDS